MKINKILNTLPQQLDQDSIYLLKNNNKLDCFVTNETGTQSYKINKNNSPNVIGRKNIYLREGNIPYAISNYDINQTYDIQVLSGSYIMGGYGGEGLNDDVNILYTAPNTIQPAGFIINGRKIELNLLIPQMNIPTIAFEGEGSIFNNYTNYGIWISNKFSTELSYLNQYYQTTGHDWELSNDNLFTDIVHQESTTVNGIYNLPVISGNTYYLRGRFNDLYLGTGPWSNIITIIAA